MRENGQSTGRFDRRRGALSATVTVIIGLMAFGAAPSVAAPAEDCATPFPVADLTDGQAVHGLTIQPVVGDTASKTTPSPFTGQVLGVLHDGIAPGIDMIMTRLASSEIDRVGGIWEGMSGSPVYASDGRLIGAVSYGLSLGPSPVAGVTPFEDMNQYVSTASSTRVQISSTDAAKIASTGDVSKAQASSGFSQLPVPKTASGLSQQRLDQVAGKRKWLKSGVRSGGSSSSLAGPSADTIVAGGNLAAAFSWGDITLAGVGTATSVCNGKVVGFGHPMLFAGKSTEALMPASALYIQEDPTLAPFKVANLGDPVGTITDDRLAGITGRFGALPRAVTVSENLTYGSKSRTGTSKVSVKSWNPDVVLDQQLANHQRLLDGSIGGTEVRTWTIAGKDGQGTPFSLSLRNRYTNDEDITFSSPWDVADQVYVLSSLKGVTLDRVDIEGTVTDDTDTYTVKGLQQLRAGVWKTVGRKRPIYARAGRTASLRAVLVSDDGTKIFAPMSVKIPLSAAGEPGYVSIGGGNPDSDYYEEEYYPSGTLAKILAAYRKAPTNDQVTGSLGLEEKDTTVNFRSAALNKVVNGYADAPLIVAGPTGAPKKLP